MANNTIYGARAFECPECEILVWGNFQFCSNCGECLIVQCDGCGIYWRVQHGFHFCPRCGDEYEVTEKETLQTNPGAAGARI